MLHVSPWKVAVIGLALLHQATPLRAQTQTVSNLSWSCTNQARTGTPVTGNSCTGSERWDYGDSGNLVAACAGSCISWQNAIWRPWSDATAQVFVCRLVRAPGPWSSCSNEGFVARAQVALTPAPPPPLPAGKPLAPGAFAATSPVGTWNVAKLEWSAVTQLDDGTVLDPAVDVVYYRVLWCGAQENCTTPTELGVTPGLTWTRDQLLEGTHWFYVTALLRGEESPRSSGAMKVVGPEPSFNFSADRTLIVAGESVTFTWSTTGMIGCARSWVTDGSATPFTGNATVAPTVDTSYELRCTSPTRIDAWMSIAVRVRPAWTPPALPKCWPVDFTRATAVRVMATGDLRSLLTSLGLQELVSTDGATSAFGYPCDTATGYTYEWFIIQHGSQDQSCWRQVSFRSLFTPQFLEAVWEVCSRELSQAETNLGADLRGAYTARFAVAAAAAGTRPVYLPSASGGVGARVTIAGVAQSIAVGRPCDGRRRLIGTTARYHEVSGMQSTTGQTLPVNSFAVCTKIDAPATGWP